VKTDTTTQGSWIGTYRSDSYNVIGTTFSNPSYPTVRHRQRLRLS
jgi:hypothetical protein